MFPELQYINVLNRWLHCTIRDKVRKKKGKVFSGEYQKTW